MESSVLVMGIPGSGKTTVARSLAKMRNGAYFSASGVLDDYVKVDSPMVARWRLAWAKGDMAPDHEVLPVLWRCYLERVSDGIVFLDGYPRTESQLEDFYSRGGTIGMALLLEMPIPIARERLLKRQSEEFRLDDATSIIHSRILRGCDQVKLMLEDARIQANLEVIDSSDFARQEILGEALRRYDSRYTKKR